MHGPWLLFSIISLGVLYNRPIYISNMNCPHPAHMPHITLSSGDMLLTGVVDMADAVLRWLMVERLDGNNIPFLSS